MSRAPASLCLVADTLAPFLYPRLHACYAPAAGLRPRTVAAVPAGARGRPSVRPSRHSATLAAAEPSAAAVDVTRYDHLTPKPLDYSSQPFVDACALTVHAGGGGHGCISFLREKYVPDGPANGGDGGTGGSIFVQAVRGETSLHKLSRRGIMKAGRGRNGEGGYRGGRRGQDVLVTVPVGTVLREVQRWDELAEEEEQFEQARRRGFGRDLESDEDHGLPDQSTRWRRDKWLLYPGALPKTFTSADFPPLPRPRRSNLAAQQPPSPLRLDLDRPTDTPILLAAGAMGGLGNPHFVTKSVTRPKYATKGEQGLKIQLHLELKLLADVGLVGLPNAGKSTLLRALTRSRTRVGSWAFTTLAPSIGTVVLDSNVGRPALNSTQATASGRPEPRSNFTIADIPGLVEDAHLDRGLGLGFLRHVERAAVLAFVIDLSVGDAVAALKALWREVGEFEKLRERQMNAESELHGGAGDGGMLSFEPFGSSTSTAFESEPESKKTGHLVLDAQPGRSLPPLALPPISSKPWFVVATKADLPDTQDNFLHLRDFLAAVENGKLEPPCGKTNAWRRKLQALPVSAINKEGVAGIPEVVVGLLDG